MQTYSEHQQDDAKFGALCGNLVIRDEAGRVRADDNSREEIADNRRQLQFLGKQAEQQGGGQASGQRQNQLDVVRHERRVSIWQFLPNGFSAGLRFGRGPIVSSMELLESVNEPRSRWQKERDGQKRTGAWRFAFAKWDYMGFRNTWNAGNVL
jgi:hypothetical protein